MKQNSLSAGARVCVSQCGIRSELESEAAARFAKESANQVSVK